MVFGKRVAIAPYLERVGEKTAREALVAMRASMREDGMGVDNVILTGGGAKTFENAARELFLKSRVIVPQDPVGANAHGFWLCGRNSLESHHGR